MNLIEDAWVPVIRADGYARIAPADLTDERNPVLRPAATRPDFNSSLMQFLIGLLQTAYPPQDMDDWLDRYLQPPSRESLQDWFRPLTPFFQLNGDGPRFMQDYVAAELDSQSPGELAALLIDAPGEQAQKFNKDLFVKRGGAREMCAACAGTALLTLQTHAPAGGAGHRTSLRGGGPLNTWLLSQELPDCPPSLWRDVWSNVLEAGSFSALGRPRVQTEEAFPWASPTRCSDKKGSELTPESGPADWLYWATPRRIRLDFDATCEGHCGICGEPGARLLQRYRTRNYGANYTTGWLHPLSPYYKAKETDFDFLPRHPKGGMDYRDWLALTVGDGGLGRAATVVRCWPARQAALRRRLRGVPRRAARLAANGYDMDNMKPLCWHESVMPVLAVSDERFVTDVKLCIDGAELAGSYLRSALKAAWFSPGATVKGDFAFATAAFWQATEPAFYRAVDALAQVFEEEASDADATRLSIRTGWLRELENEALKLFELHAESGPAEQGNVKRVALAHRQLMQSLRGPKLKAALGFAPPEVLAAKGSKARTSTVAGKG